jgi:hypothetical protein
MSQPTPTGPPALPANSAHVGLLNDEPALVTLFMDLTGESEAQAGSTFIFVSRDNQESSNRLQG